MMIMIRSNHIIFGRQSEKLIRPMITFRQLRYFEALARCLHFGQAAKDCAVTQPALSMQIKELEETLGVVLIERQAAKITLTPQGHDVLEKVQTIMDSLQDLENYSKKKQEILTGNYASASSRQLPPIYCQKLYLL